MKYTPEKTASLPQNN